ncbi:hypothetical protein Anapl_08565 [Anas platyrhynchos]|uniref:Uncharacterized protein n=1 Tax=Anas platyrhynchos TaxID=8839 RepID=R0KGH4_ANAPL|nr:hypothetical protein Anapl_08565 [Anas platyrhynchos]
MPRGLLLESKAGMGALRCTAAHWYGVNASAKVALQLQTYVSSSTKTQSMLGQEREQHPGYYLQLDLHFFLSMMTTNKIIHVTVVNVAIECPSFHQQNNLQGQESFKENHSKCLQDSRLEEGHMKEGSEQNPFASREESHPFKASKKIIIRHALGKPPQESNAHAKLTARQDKGDMLIRKATCDAPGSCGSFQ